MPSTNHFPRYHWAIIVGPKVEDEHSTGTIFHARERISIVDGEAQSSWVFEDRPTALMATAMQLVRILVGKVASTERVESVLKSTSVKNAQPGWNCVSWVKEALESLEKEGKAMGTSKTK